MNKIKTLALVLFSSAALLATSCSKDNDNTPEPVKPVTISVNTVTDLNGVGRDVYYSLSQNAEVTGADITSNKWDIKFTATSIFVNGGTSGTGTTQAQVVNSTFADLKKAPVDGYKTDATGANAITAWYTYTAETAPQHAILATPGKIIVIKTTDGKYAKLEMKSYYKGNPDTTTPAFADLATRPASRYYTFRFAYQADGSTTLE